MQGDFLFQVIAVFFQRHLDVLRPRPHRGRPG